jgi:hypothetical protein
MSAIEHWLLSPVVGEVSNLKAVIICEPIVKTSPLNYSVKGSVRKGMIEPYTHTGRIETEEVGPTRFVLSFPEDGYYEIKWFSEQKEIFQHGIIVTNQPNKMIFVSCDLLEADTASNDSMWSRMQSEIIPGRRTCLIHVGDQSYMDKVFKDSVCYVSEHGYNDDTAQHIIHAFGKRYCDTWMPHHNILARVSNYNLWDDHEIKNNIMLNDTTLNDNEKYVRDLAVRSYILYQESQHLDKEEIISRYSWNKRMGAEKEILVLAIERTSRLVSVKEVLDGIKTLTTDVRTDRLILCFASAPIPPPHGRYGTLYRKFVGDKGTAETSKFWASSDLAELYRGLFSWMGTDKEKEVLVVGGDLHFGTYGVARRSGREISVVISSPVTNQPTTDRWLAAKGMPGLHYITHDEDMPITFSTISSQARRCYASVDLDTVPMRVVMHYSTCKLPDSSIKYLKTLISFR